MAGRIKQMIDTIVEQEAKGDPRLINITRTKLIVRGIHPDKYSAHSEDDPIIIRQLEKMIRLTGISNVAVAVSQAESVKEAVSEIKNAIRVVQPKMILYFASSSYNAQDLAQRMKENFPQACVFGCSTAGELANTRMLKNSVVAMAMNANLIEDVRVATIRDVRHADGVSHAFSEFEQHFRTPMRDLDFQKYVGIILFDGLAGAEEQTMETIGDLTRVLFIGGSAGDDQKFVSTQVAANGKAYSNAAVLALIKPAVKFDFIKTQSFRPLEKHLVPTKINEKTREVCEFDGKPAVDAYAEAVGCPREEVSEHFMVNPLGLVVGHDDIYVRSPFRAEGDSLYLFCHVKAGMDLALLESTNIIVDTKVALERKKLELGRISAIINFHCILRTLELEQKHQTEEYGRIFSGIPTIGFSTYGEEFIGHINQTSTMLVFR
ncbi:FIST N-terminal domain-containing protein [uncultured Methanoregula sp.]|uniref:FIST signal transduction protein n=1 Tax=uncultured Methanoregula sp. TaxID=1005933 RepID=UPI002AABBA16|nr:FIST N-terminal domain-containing protein [uncultured Methanoregula sp.]